MISSAVSFIREAFRLEIEQVRHVDVWLWWLLQLLDAVHAASLTADDMLGALYFGVTSKQRLKDAQFRLAQAWAASCGFTNRTVIFDQDESVLIFIELCHIAFLLS